MTLTYYVWELDPKTKVPKKILETTNSSIAHYRITKMLSEDVQFAFRVEDIK